MPLCRPQPPMSTEDMLRNTFAINMRALREDIGLSQEKLADIAGLHRTYIGSIERGERNLSIDNIEKISLALGVAPHTLLLDKENEIKES